ncbi:hypothetical protein OsI_37442 [Oryza sativa Indica Group]|uniref:Uncharacterized protein n=1 Tax=Oryza sativa subsp. indica TaxID=39946 RepID=A2ZI03_ORYSI|nr:hypothetical protein OsI_37442 [Oryza sativa Indica Group]
MARSSEDQVNGGYGDYSEGGIGRGTAWDGYQLEHGDSALKGDLQHLCAVVNMGHLLGASNRGANFDVDCSRIGSGRGGYYSKGGVVRDGDQLECRSSVLKGDQHRHAAEDGCRSLRAADGGGVQCPSATMSIDCLLVSSGREAMVCGIIRRAAPTKPVMVYGETLEADAIGRGHGRGLKVAAAWRGARTW